MLNESDKLIIQLSPSITSLEDVVVTGQFSPSSAERSVFKVERILKEEFESRGAVTLEDALKSQLNIIVIKSIFCTGDLSLPNTILSINNHFVRFSMIFKLCLKS